MLHAIKYNVLKGFRSKNLFSQVEYSCKEGLKDCKFRLIIVSILCIIACFIGVFMAIRLRNQDLLENAAEYGFSGVAIIGTSSFSGFFSRLLSLLAILGLLTAFSFSPFLYVLSGIVLCYRAYLVGLNITLIIICNGLGGIFTTILIILPCQLLLLAALIAFFCLFSKQSALCKKGCASFNRWKIVLIFIFILIFINLIESLLLLIFSSSVILVI